jgi:hypothetical protein
MWQVSKITERYRHGLQWVDAQLYALNTTEHGVLVAIMGLACFLLLLAPKFLILLLSGIGILLLACTAYVAYRLSVRLEPKDDYE